MVQAVEKTSRTELRRSVVLMARIVDREGRCIGRSDVAAVAYAVYQVDHRQPSERTAVAGHVAARLAVADVLFDDLQLDGGWLADGCGYNFRHTIGLLLPCCEDQRGRQHYEVQYELVTRFGEATRICFEIRV